MEETTTTPSENMEVETTKEGDENQVLPDTKSKKDPYDEVWDKLDKEDNVSFEDVFGNGDTDSDSDTTTDNDSTNSIGSSTDTDTSDDGRGEGLLIKNPVLKYKGKEIPISSEEELIALAQKGMSYEKKMADIKPYRQIVDIVKKQGLTSEDIQALADLYSGKKEALGYIKSKAGIEDTKESDEFGSIFGSDDETNDEPSVDYQPEVEESDPVQDIWKQVSDENPELAGKISSIWKDLPDDFKIELWNEKTFPSFVISVYNGEFDKGYPMAIKEKSLNPQMTWLQAYVEGLKKLGSPTTKQEPSPEIEPKVSNKSSVERKPKVETYDDAFNVPLEDLEKELFG